MKLPVAFETGRVALIVGHPGHALRVLGWLRACRPVVAVLTDGSGSGETGRIGLTTELLDAAGCRRAGIYGALSDREVYAAILAGDAGVFLALSERLAAWLVEEQIDLVASDPAEGFNPTHDLCAAIAARAARIASAARGVPVDHVTFVLLGPPTVDDPPAQAVVLTLDASALADKLAEARRYAALTGGALVGELDAMIALYGEAAFRTEFFVPARVPETFAGFAHEAPYYEKHGEKQVAAGRYTDVIRYREHLQPIVAVLAA
jgi:hypothetical protein